MIGLLQQNEFIIILFNNLQKLEVLTNIVQNVDAAQNAIKQDHEDLKMHTLNRLDAIDEKTAWCLSNGQQGSHPLSDRMSRIEDQLTRIEKYTCVRGDDYYFYFFTGGN